MGIINKNKAITLYEGTIMGAKEKNLNEERIQISKLDEFIKNESDIIQDYFSKKKLESKDNIFGTLKNYEKGELEKTFKELSKSYKKNFLKEDKLILNNINDSIIENIIENENSENVYKKKIIDEIENIKKDDSQYEIKYLTVLLVGRKGVGKTTLINYMLKLNQNISDSNNINSNQNFIEYKSSKVPFLKLIEFKGIGLSKNNEPEKVGDEAVKCIRDLIESKNNKNYNDFIHCIWYCISGTRFEKSERELFEKLSQAYDNSTIPIIIVYTQNIDNKASNEMEKYIKNLGICTSFIKVIAKDIKLMNSNDMKKSFGEKELLNETVQKFTTALKGNMFNLMTKTISEEIKKKMLKLNEDLEKKIKETIINNFIYKYKYILKDEEFKKHIVNMIGNNLFTFYEKYNKKISNKSLNLLKNSDIINSVSNFISYYKPEVNKIIESEINKQAEIFIDVQASVEKNNNNNMRLDNKRYLFGFKRSNTTFYKRNFYYISQKFIIYLIIKKICIKFFNCFRIKLDNIIKSLLEKDAINKDINNYLEECFLTKLEKYTKKNNLIIIISHPEFPELKIEIKEDIEEIIDKDITQKSIELIDDFNEYEEKEKGLSEENQNEENWYPFGQTIMNYLNEDSKISLKEFLEKKMIYQEFYFVEKNVHNDKVLDSLKKYEKNELIKFFESQKINFIKEKIFKTYNTKKITCDKVSIKKIVSSNEFKDIYINKINKEIDKINKDKIFCQIEHLSIIVIGRSGVGKSTLVNAMLKKKVALTGLGKIITTENKAYKSDSFPFLRLIDSRGIELDSDFGPSAILNNTLDTIKEQKNKIQSDKNGNFNDYIQCIWYCLSNNYFEKKEIDIIKSLKKNKEFLPIIIVYTNAQNNEDFIIKQKKIKEIFQDIPFIPVLAEANADGILHSYGLDNLLNETLKIFKKFESGNNYKEMREISLKKIQNNFKESNNKIKININNYLVHKFTDDYNKVLSKEELFNYIFNLFESIYTAYLKSNDLKEKIKLTQENKDLLKTMTNIQDYITNFIIHYEKNSKIIVDSISQKKSIEFLDEQVRKEKKEFERCLNNKNKSTKEDFKYIIETFLNDNFYYISQKYLIYRVFTDVCETISDRIEIEVNEIIKDLLDKKNPKDLLIKIYNQKFKDLEERINKYRKDDNKIYNHKENKSIVHNNLPTNIKENIHKSYKPGISDLAPIPTIK